MPCLLDASASRFRPLVLLCAAACTPGAPSPQAAVVPATQARSVASPSPSPSPSASAADASLGLEVAVTVDDLPVHGPSFVGIDRVAIADRMLATFRAHHMPPVYGFVNGKRVDDAPETEAVLRHWVAAGNPLGNHTYSHVSLNRAEIPEYLADLEKGETVLTKLVPDERAWKVFRFPYLFEGNTLEKRDAVRAYLKKRGYSAAEVTIDADDWAYNPPYARCRDQHDSAAIAELLRGLVDAHVGELRHVRDLTRTLAGRGVKHVLLLHVGAAEADALDALLTAYEREGVRWIALDAALADPFYAFDPHIAHAHGSAFPYVVAKARGVAIPPHPPTPVEDRADAMCR